MTPKIDRIVSACGTCGKKLELLPWQLKRKRHFCNKTCWAKAPNRNWARKEGCFECSLCLQQKSKEMFYWAPRPGTNNLYRRNPCLDCMPTSRRENYLKNKENEKLSHKNWCEKKLNDTNDQASLLHYFKRKMASLRKRSIKLKVDLPTVTPEFLVELFNKQNGKCFYSGRQLLWRNFGVGHMSRKKSLLSMDRKDPTKGYLIDNVVLCTTELNTLKWTNSVEELYSLCEEILKQRDLQAISDPIQSNPV